MEGLRDVTAAASVSVSSAKRGHGATALVDGSILTFWQSDGALPHAVTLRFARRTPVAAVRVFLSHADDDSYTPRELAVCAGPDVYSLAAVARVDVTHPTGWVTIPLADTADPATPLVIHTPLPTLTSLLTSSIPAPQHRDLTTRLRAAVSDPLRTYVVQIEVRANHQNGKDSHIRLVQALAPAAPPSLTPGDLPDFSAPIFRDAPSSIR